MAKRLDWDKVSRQRKAPKHEWIKWDPVKKASYYKRRGWNATTWQAERARVQALADAAAPMGTGATGRDANR